jgi:hypothetical protein
MLRGLSTAALSRGNRALCSAVVLLATLLVADRAQGFAEIQLTGPTAISLGAPQLLTYRATFAAGANEHRFVAQVSAPEIPEGGASMLLADAHIVSGSGGVIEPVIQSASRRSCSSIPGQERHGYPNSGVTAHVELAPSSHITIEYVFRTGDFPIRPGDSFSPRLIFPFAVSDSSPPFGGVTFPAPVPSGAQGVYIKLGTRPGGSAAFPDPGFPGLPQLGPTPLLHSPPVQIRRGRPITIVGGTTPRLVRQKIRVINTSPGHSEVRTLARVRTDKKGKFRVADWMPKTLGPYEISATYRSQRPNRLSDFAACSKRIVLVPKG